MHTLQRANRDCVSSCRETAEISLERHTELKLFTANLHHIDCRRLTMSSGRMYRKVYMHARHCCVGCIPLRAPGLILYL